MKKAIIVEIVWLAGLLGLAFLISAWIISNNALDISAHDTYNLDGSKFSPWAPFVFTLFILGGFITYFIRAIFFRFRILRLCIILMIFTCLVLGAIERSEYSFNSFLSKANWEYSAPANTATVKGLFYGGDSSVLVVGQLLLWFKAFLTLTLMFASFMIGRNWRKAVN